MIFQLKRRSLVALALLSALLGSRLVLAKAEVESCPALMAELMKSIWSHDTIHDEPVLPEKPVDLSLKKTTFDGYFRLCEDLWLTGFERKEFRDFIREVKEGHTPTPEQDAMFKEIRARLKQLRFAYVAFDVNHDYPEEIDGLATKLGHLQDAIKNKQPKLIIKEAKKAEDLLSKAAIKELQRELDGFQPAKKKDFRKFIREDYKALKRALGEGKVAPKEFHEMRKVISRQVAIYDVINTVDPSPEAEMIVKYLGTLNGKMGGLHDKLIQGKFSGGVDYYHGEMEVPADIRVLLQNLVDHIDVLDPVDESDK